MISWSLLLFYFIVVVVVVVQSTSSSSSFSNCIAKLTARKNDHIGNENALAIRNNRFFVGAPGHKNNRRRIPNRGESSIRNWRFSLPMMVAIGATRVHSGGMPGVAYVCRIVTDERNNRTIQQRTKLTASNGIAYDRSVSLFYCHFGRSAFYGEEWF
jgi:hypothetical protein